MNDKVKLACGRQIVAIPLSQILPVKVITEQMRQTLKYSRIAASMREVGVIEPLVVYPQRSNGGQYILLDGHIRLEILRSMNQETADCLVADDDEAYTYNHKVSRLSAIQEHFMIMKAIKSGVSDERIAKSLHVDVGAIRRKVDVLEGICPEAVELLRTRNASAGTLRELKRVLPMRQIEMAELMVASRNFSTAYVKCLYAATPVEQLLESEKPKDVAGLSPNDIARMEREMESLSKDFRTIEEVHGQNVLSLVLIAAYLKKLLDNARVVRYLSQNYLEILDEFQKIAESRSLGEGK